MIDFKKTKRTEGKFKKDLCTKDFYKDYCRASFNNKRIPVDYAVYYKVVRAFNKSLQEKIVKPKNDPCTAYVARLKFLCLLQIKLMVF